MKPNGASPPGPRGRDGRRRTGTLWAGSCLLLGGLAVTAAPAAASPVVSTLYAASTAQGAADCSSVANACDLATALNDAIAGTTVLLVTAGVEGTSSSYYVGNWTVDPSGTTALSQVTVEPYAGVVGPILDGNGGQSAGCPTTSCAGSVLTIGSGVFATVTGVTIQDGDNTSGNGGGIENDGTLALTDSTVSQNTTGAGSSGGGIDNTAALSITNSTVSQNTTGNAAGGCDGDAPGCSDTNGGTSGGGGGIESSGSLTVTDSTISGNATGTGGGGGEGAGEFCASGGDGGSSGAGGGIESPGGLILTGSTISQNTTGIGGGGGPGGCPTAAGGNGGSGGSGAGIDAAGATTVSTSTISGNTTGGGGSGVGGSSSSGGPGRSGSNGGSGGSGAGIEATSDLSVATSTIALNTTGGGGSGGNGGNGAADINVPGGSGGNGGPGGSGAGLDGGTTTVSSSTISGNSVGAGGTGGTGGIGNTCGGPGCLFLVPTQAGGGANGPAGAGAGTNGAATTLLADLVATQTSGSDCGNAAGITDDGYNLDGDGSCDLTTGTGDISGVDPQLGPLGNYGGPTQTMVPGPGSPAEFVIPPNTTLDTIVVCPRTDQTGASAPLAGEGGCTIGATEPVVPTPTITSVTPNTGPVTGGTPITIMGSGFVAGATVAVGQGHGAGAGTIPAIDVDVVSPSEITATTGGGALAGVWGVFVTTTGRTSAATTQDHFAYEPTVTAVTAGLGPASGGTPITITGNGFTSSSTVVIGQGHGSGSGAIAATAVHEVSPSEITAVTPGDALAGTWGVFVTVNGVTSAATAQDHFTYLPTVTSVSPASGPTSGASNITITGSGFAAGSAVVIGQGNGAGAGAIAATNVVVVSPTEITATTGGGASAGTWGVFVKSNGATSAYDSAATFDYHT
jgi:hypothetical protein